MSMATMSARLTIPTSLPPDTDGHPVDSPTNPQVPHVFDVSVFGAADDCRRHDVKCSGTARFDEQVVFADQRHNVTVTIDNRDGADSMLVEGRCHAGDNVISLHHNDGAVMISQTVVMCDHGRPGRRCQPGTNVLHIAVLQRAF